MIYLIYSKEEEIIEKYIEKLIKKENIDSNSIIKYTLDEDNISNLILECNTTGLFSLKKLVLIDSTNALSSKGKEFTELTEYLNNYNKDIIMVFIASSDKVDTRKKLYKQINEIGKIESLVKDNNYLVNFVKEKLLDYKLEDIDYFINKVGSNINALENELEKLKNYKIKEKIITKKDIDDLCENTTEEEIFALTDAIINNDNNKAIKLFRNFLNKNYEITQMIGLLASQFRFLLQVKILYNKNKTKDEIANILEVHPYRVKLALNSCYYYDRYSLENYLIKLFELDKNIKLGLIDKNIYFELFILNKNF